MVEWGNPDWGKPGSNVHYADNGSWVTDHSGEDD